MKKHTAQDWRQQTDANRWNTPDPQDPVISPMPSYVQVGGDHDSLLDQMFKETPPAPGKHTASSEIVLILDRSGSMGSVRDDLIGGVNTFISEQQKEGDDVLVSCVQFDDRYGDPAFWREPLKTVKPLDRATYAPRGLTSLYDAVAKTINTYIGWKDDGTVTGKVMFVIHTDGGENSSQEFKDVKAITDLIDLTKEQYGWDFIFLGSAPDAWNEGMNFLGSVGVLNTISTHNNTKGLSDGYAYAASTTRAFRTGKKLDEAVMRQASAAMAAGGDASDILAQVDKDLQDQDGPDQD